MEYVVCMGQNSVLLRFADWPASKSPVMILITQLDTNGA